MDRAVDLYRGNWDKEDWSFIGEFENENKAIDYMKQKLREEKFKFKYLRMLLEKNYTTILDYGSYHDFFKYVYKNHL